MIHNLRVWYTQVKRQNQSWKRRISPHALRLMKSLSFSCDWEMTSQKILNFRRGCWHRASYFFFRLQFSKHMESRENFHISEKIHCISSSQNASSAHASKPKKIYKPTSTFSWAGALHASESKSSSVWERITEMENNRESQNDFGAKTYTMAVHGAKRKNKGRGRQF